MLERCQPAGLLPGLMTVVPQAPNQSLGIDPPNCQPLEYQVVLRSSHESLSSLLRGYPTKSLSQMVDWPGKMLVGCWSQSNQTQRHCWSLSNWTERHCWSRTVYLVVPGLRSVFQAVPGPRYVSHQGFPSLIRDRGLPNYQPA